MNRFKCPKCQSDKVIAVLSSEYLEKHIVLEDGTIGQRTESFIGTELIDPFLLCQNCRADISIDINEDNKIIILED